MLGLILSMLAIAPDDPATVSFGEAELAASATAAEWIRAPIGDPSAFETATADATGALHVARLRFELPAGANETAGSTREPRSSTWLLSLGATEARCDARFGSESLIPYEDPWTGPSQLRAGRMFSVPSARLKVGQNEILLTFEVDVRQSGLAASCVQLYPPLLAARLKNRLEVPIAGLDTANLEIVASRGVDGSLAPRLALREPGEEGRFRLHAILDFQVRDASASERPIPFDELTRRTQNGDIPFCVCSAQETTIPGLNLRGLMYAPLSLQTVRHSRSPFLFLQWSNPRTGLQAPPLDLAVLFFPMMGGPLHFERDANVSMLSNSSLTLGMYEGEVEGPVESPRGMQNRMKVVDSSRALGGPTTELVLFPTAAAGRRRPSATQGADSQGTDAQDASKDEEASSDPLDLVATMLRRSVKFRPAANAFSATVPVVPHVEGSDSSSEPISTQFGNLLLATRRAGEGYVEQHRSELRSAGTFDGAVLDLLFPAIAPVTLEWLFAEIASGDDPFQNAALVLRATRHALLHRPQDFLERFTVPLAETLRRNQVLEKESGLEPSTAALTAVAFLQLSRCFEALGAEESSWQPLREESARRTAAVLALGPGSWSDDERAILAKSTLVQYAEIPVEHRTALLDEIEAWIAARPVAGDRASLHALLALTTHGRFARVAGRIADILDRAQSFDGQTEMSPALMDLVQFGLCGVSRSMDGSWRCIPAVDSKDDFSVRIGTASGTLSVRCYSPNVQFQRQLMVQNDSLEECDLVIGFPSRLGAQREEIFGVLHSIVNVHTTPGKTAREMVR